MDVWGIPITIWGALWFLGSGLLILGLAIWIRSLNDKD